MRIFIIFLIAFLTLGFGYSDQDMDGVEDDKDQCPYTLFSDLVDDQGCSIKSLNSDIHYDISAGLGYSQMNYASLDKANTLTTTLQSNIYKGRESFHFSTSYYRSHESGSTQQGWNDTYIGYSVRSLPSHGLTFGGNIGMVLPTYKSTYNNEAVDLSGGISLRYQATEDISFFGGYSYTLVNDKSIPSVVTYQNTQSFYGGMSHTLNHNTSISLSYNQSESIYRDVTTIKSVAVGTFYQLDSHWFTLFDYRHGLSDSTSDHDLSLKIGYYF